MKYLLSPKVDFIFKKIFGNEAHPEILISFLNAILKPKDPIISVEIKNTDMEKDYINDKFSILDVKATTDQNEIVNIEIQLKDEKNMKERTLYYWSRMYAEQLLEGENYAQLARTVCINILDFHYLDNGKFHSIYRLKEVDTQNELVDKIEIHFVELPKFEICDTNSQLDLWVEFIKQPQSEIIEHAKESIVEIHNAKKELSRISMNDSEREMYELREKALRDRTNALDSAKQEGILQGILEGILQGRLEGKLEGKLEEKKAIATQLLDVLDNETIALKTGLSIAEIQTLR